MQKLSSQFVIVGSGAGGAVLAMELSRRGADVLVLERGRHEPEVGGLRPALRYFDAGRLGIFPRKSREGVILWRTLMAGGTTVVSCGNGVPCLRAELAALGIDLAEELAEAGREMRVQPTPPELVSQGSRRIAEAAAELGCRMDPMPKAIDPAACARCGRCVLGCKRDAKWTALDCLAEAQRNGARLFCGADVREAVVEGGRAAGVRAVGPDGPMEARAETVVLAAGGLGTPPILQRSGLSEAGEGLFADLFVNVYGVAPGLSQAHEPPMPLVCTQFHDSDGFILSPFVNRSRVLRFMEMGLRGAVMPGEGLVGLMVKTADDAAGRVDARGGISKPVTDADRRRLDKGAGIAREILLRAGARERSVVRTRVQGAHPGGTAAVGRVVDSHLRTRIEGLYVCDASVLPAAPGLPPILTIVALAKRLARHLAGGA